MGIIELLQTIGEDKIAMQVLAEAVTNISRSGRHRGASAVTFLTTHMSPNDALQPGGEVGLVLWIKRDDLPEGMR
jgi:hypothetical protein